ncbi:MAG: right-handed parallel beta-helix repeat-containing protein [Myxococcota bacterium]
MHRSGLLGVWWLLAGCNGNSTRCPDGLIERADGACVPEEEGGNGAEADIDTDTDADTDTDTDADADTDTDADPEFDVCAEGAPFTRIQDAIDAAGDGDEVMVCGGTYQENVVISDKSIRLIGFLGSERTAIDGTNTAPALAVLEGAGFGTLISGFTLRNGVADAVDGYSGGYGGGLLIRNANPTVEDVVVRDSLAANGGGVAMVNSNGVIDGVTVTDSDAEEHGGGIFVSGGDPTIRHALVERCFSVDGGSGLYATLTGLQLYNSIFYRNTGSTASPGVLVENGESADFYNLIVSYNEASGASGDVCALDARSGTAVYNSIAFVNDGIGMCTGNNASHNLSFANDQDFLRSPGETDLNDDPAFARASDGNFILQPQSIAIDGGLPDPQFNDPDGSRADLGAYGGPFGEW